MLTGTDRRIAIPIVLNFHDGSMCDGGAATTCKFDPDVVADKIWTCAK
jgi:hypothetical protein